MWQTLKYFLVFVIVARFTAVIFNVLYYVDTLRPGLDTGREVRAVTRLQLLHFQRGYFLCSRISPRPVYNTEIHNKS